MDSGVALVRCADYAATTVEGALRQAVGFLGGIEKIIKPKSRVLLKPNLLTAKDPENAVTTHPEVVRAAIHLLKDINSQIFLGDAPSVWARTPKDIELIWEKSGIGQVARQEGVELVKFDRSCWRGKFPLTRWLNETEYLVSLPKFKTHSLTVLTAAIKNLFGLVCGRYKLELHKQNFAPALFASMLVDLYEVAQPALTIVDGIVALEGEGPSSRGKQRKLGLLAAGIDCVSIDSVLAVIMGLKPEDILTTKEAAQRRLGNSRTEHIPIYGEGPEFFRNTPFKLPAASFIYCLPQPLLAVASKLLRFYPKIDLPVCSKCGVCAEVCPENIIRKFHGVMTIDYSRCISCFCCQEACPEAAIGVKKSFIAKMLKV